MIPFVTILAVKVGSSLTIGNERKTSSGIAVTICMDSNLRASRATCQAADKFDQSRLAGSRI